MRRSLKELWRYREVLWLLTARDLKIRYRNSVLGFFWSLLNPLLQVGILVVVFRFIVRVEEENYSFKVLSCYLGWMFFLQAILDGSVCVAQNIELVRTTYFPRLILPLSSLASNFVHFVLAMAVLSVIFFIHPVHVPWYCVLLFPLVVAVQMVLMSGLILIVSALSVFYTDIRYLVQHLLQIAFFLSPILYSTKLVEETDRFSPGLKTAYWCNPLAPIMAAYRWILLQGAELKHLPYADFWWSAGLACGVSLALLAIGLLLFGRLQWAFAEHA